MSSTINLLYKHEYPINDSIHVMIPTVGDVVDNEDSYYNLVAAFTSMPIDMMVQLDEIGIDFTTINEYELFLLMFDSIKTQDTSLLFGDLDLSNFEIMENVQNNTLVARDDVNDITIDRAIYNQIAMTLRKIHHLEKNRRKPANQEAKEYMLERAKKKAQRKKNRKTFSNIEGLIIAMVNTEQFKYDFEGTRKLTIYQFNESILQVRDKIDYDNKMHGIYAGTVDYKSLKPDELNWLSHK